MGEEEAGGQDQRGLGVMSSRPHPAIPRAWLNAPSDMLRAAIKRIKSKAAEPKRKPVVVCVPGRPVERRP